MTPSLRTEWVMKELGFEMLSLDSAELLLKALLLAETIS